MDIRGEEQDARQKQAEREGAVAVDPEGEERRQSEKPARAAGAAEMEQGELSDEQKVADHLRANREANGREEPDGECAEEADFGVARAEPAEAVAGDENCGGGKAEPQHEAGVATKAVGGEDEGLCEPLMREGGVVLRGVREEVGSGDGVGGPDELAGAEVQPEVGVVETIAHGEYGEYGEEAGDQRGKGEDSAQTRDASGFCCGSGGQRRSAHASSNLARTGSWSRSWAAAPSESALRRRRCR